MSAVPERPTTPISVVIGLSLLGLFVGLLFIWWIIGIVSALVKLAFFLAIFGAVIYGAAKLANSGD